MVQRIDTGALPAFTGAAMPRHEIPGPGPDALKLIAGTDRTTWLVSPGVIDCTVLSVVLSPGMRPPSGPAIGHHRTMGCRAMAHFNPFSGPRQDTIRQLFDSLRGAYAAGPDAWSVSITYNASARRPYINQLFSLVANVVPDLSTVSVCHYGGPPTGARGLTPAISVYLGPNGQLSGSLP